MEQKCPVIGCTTKGVKTQLIEDGVNSTCPKCQGEWSLDIGAPMDICWIETKKPITI